MDVHKKTIDCTVMGAYSAGARLERRVRNDVRSLKRFCGGLLAEGAGVCSSDVEGDGGSVLETDSKVGGEAAGDGPEDRGD